MSNFLLKTAIFLFSVSMLCSCCRNDEYYWDFNKEGTINIPLDDSIIQNKILYIPKFRYCIIDGVETLIAYVENNKLTFFDIEKKEPYHEINLLADRPLCTFEYINKDSILVLYDAPYYSYMQVHNCSNRECKVTELPYDATCDTLRFMLVDYEGNVKKHYHFNCEKSNFDGLDLTEADVLPPYTFLDGEMKRAGNIVFLYPRRYSYNNCDSIENSKPFLAYYDLNTEKYYFTRQKLPYLKNKMYYPVLEGGHHNHVNFCISPDGMPVIRFPYSADVFEWDYKNDKLIPHTLKSKLVDTIPPLKYKTDVSDAMVACYGNIVYDSVDGMYYSSIWLNGMEKTYCSVVMADRDFNYIGETVKPFVSMSMVDGRRISCSVSQDTIRINVYRKQKKSGHNTSVDSLRYVIDGFRNDKEQKASQYYTDGQDPLINYFDRNVPDHESDYCIVTLYFQAGCVSCRMSVLELIAANQEILSQRPLYLILTGYKSRIDNELNDHDLRLDKFNNVIVDDEAIVSSFPMNSPFVNPRLTIVRGGKVELDSVYNAQDIEDALIPTMIDACGLRMEIY